LLICICLISASCPLVDKLDEEPPPYKAEIAWDSKLYVNFSKSHILYGDNIYFYECPPEYHEVNIYALTKLDAETGKLLWRSMGYTKDSLWDRLTEFYAPLKDFLNISIEKYYVIQETITLANELDLSALYMSPRTTRWFSRKQMAQPQWGFFRL